MMLGGAAPLKPQEIISSLYKAILGREPDQKGHDDYLKLMDQGVPLQTIIESFLQSAEFIGALDALPANPIQVDLSLEQREAVWRRLADNWSRLGKSQPFFSVLTSGEFRLESITPEAIERFYATGQTDVARAAKYLARNHCRLPADGVCVDYGCGLGRTTLWLARHFKRVLAIDVSETHLTAARHALAERGIRNVEFHLVRGPGDLAVLRGCDFFYSLIALQHSPPPVILEILQAAFAALKKGGSAFFQVPTYGTDYHWLFDEYISERNSEDELGMHVVPQSLIFAAAANAGCRPLEVQPDWYTGKRHWISNTFLFVKRPRAIGIPGRRRLGFLDRVRARVTS